MSIPFPYLVVFLAIGLVLSLFIGIMGWAFALVGGYLLHERF